MDCIEASMWMQGGIGRSREKRKRDFKVIGAMTTPRLVRKGKFTTIAPLENNSFTP